MKKFDTFLVELYQVLSEDMSTKGKKTWDKYYAGTNKKITSNGKPNVKTKVRTETKLFKEPSIKSEVLQTLLPGVEVTVFNDNQHGFVPLGASATDGLVFVQVTTELSGWARINDLKKPINQDDESSKILDFLSMNPQKLDLVGTLDNPKKLTVKSFGKELEKAILEKNKDKETESIKKYLVLLVNYLEGKTSAKKDINDHFKELNLDEKIINAIVVSFGELMAALASINGLIEGIDISGDSVVEFPSSQTESLYDYTVFTDGKAQQISVKSGRAGRANSMRPNNILDLVKRAKETGNEDVLKTLKKFDHELKVLDILSVKKNSGKTATDTLWDAYVYIVDNDLTPSKEDKQWKKYLNPKLWDKLEMGTVGKPGQKVDPNNPNKRNIITNIRKVIIKASNINKGGKLNYNNLFDIILGNGFHVVKVNINKEGIPYFYGSSTVTTYDKKAGSVKFIDTGSVSDKATVDRALGLSTPDFVEKTTPIGEV